MNRAKQILRTRRRYTRCNKQGAAAVEFAVVAPLLFVMIFLLFETSRALMGLHAVSGAAREAARVFAVRGDSAAARDVAIDYLMRSSFNIADANVNFAESASDTPNVRNVSCTVEVDYADVSIVGGTYSLGDGVVRGYGAMMVVEGG